MALRGYTTYDPSAADREKEELDKVFGAKILKFKVGRNIVRILPPAEGRDTPFELIWMHFVDVTYQDKPIVFPCPRRMANRPCPVCSKGEEMRTSGDPNQTERAKKLFPKRQWYANAIDRKQIEEGVQLIAVGKEIMNQLVAIRKTFAEDGLDFTHPYDGYDIIVERTGTGMEDTEYTSSARAKPSPLGDDDEQMQAWIDGMVDLKAKALPPSTEEIMMKLKNPNAAGSNEPSAPRGAIDASARDKKQQRSLPQRTAEDDAEDDAGDDEVGDDDGSSSGGDSVDW